MKYFELKNTKTQATAQVVAKNLMDAYKQVGWKPQHGRLIWKADASAANDKGEYWAEETRLFYFGRACMADMRGI